MFQGFWISFCSALCSVFIPFAIKGKIFFSQLLYFIQFIINRYFFSISMRFKRNKKKMKERKMWKNVLNFYSQNSMRIPSNKAFHFSICRKRAIRKSYKLIPNQHQFSIYIYIFLHQIFHFTLAFCYVIMSFFGGWLKLLVQFRLKRIIKCLSFLSTSSYFI